MRSADRDDMYRSEGIFDWSYADFPFPKIIHATSRNLSDMPYESNWISLNPGWKIHKADDAEVKALILDRVPHASVLVKPEERNRSASGAEIADVWRIAVLYEQGGVYFDTDVEEEIPIERWLPNFNFDNDVDLVLGVEFPKRAGPNPVQFETWAILAKPHNSILKHALHVISQNLLHSGDDTGNEDFVIQRTGNGAWTHAVLECIHAGGATLPSLDVLNGGPGALLTLNETNGSTMKLAMLPYRAFGFSKFHNGNEVVKGTAEEHLVEHHFFGSWKAGRSFNGV